jgi:hypothetical protein
MFDGSSRSPVGVQTRSLHDRHASSMTAGGMEAAATLSI